MSGYIVPKRPRLLIIILISTIFLSAGCARFFSEKSESDGELFRKGERLYKEAKYRKSGRLMEQLIQEYFESEYKAAALFILAETQFLRGKYEEAQFNYDKFIEMHPAHSWAEKALYRSALCSFNKILSADKDQTYTLNAVNKLNAFMVKYPQSRYGEEVQQRIIFARQRLAEQELYVADYFSKTKAYDQAILRYKHLLDKYPDSDSTERAMFSLGRIYEKTGQKERARRIYRKLINAHPSTELGKKARNRL